MDIQELFENLPEHLQDKIIRMYPHPVADLLKEYKEQWDEHYDFYETEDLSKELWGSKILQLGKRNDFCLLER